jgi:hypothetical protein
LACEDQLAWFLLDVVDELDLSELYAAYRADGWGRAAHDPSMMLAVLDTRIETPHVLRTLGAGQNGRRDGPPWLRARPSWSLTLTSCTTSVAKRSSETPWA